MTKKEKATALAARHEMVEKGISANQILRFATTAEVHGYWKGTFRHAGRPANLYALAARILERKQVGVPVNHRREVTYSLPVRHHPVATTGSVVQSPGCQMALIF